MKTVKCSACGASHEIPDHRFRRDIRRKQQNYFCSSECIKQYRLKAITIPCAHCGTSVIRKMSQMRKVENGRAFCGRSCAAFYNNKIRKKSRRSRCEKELEKMIKESFPELCVLSNDKTLLGGFEADIAIPELKLAIEWNGIVHFKPIYGQVKLSKIQDMDARKIMKAEELGINLIVIPDMVSTQHKVKEAFLSISHIIQQMIHVGEVGDRI